MRGLFASPIEWSVPRCSNGVRGSLRLDPASFLMSSGAACPACPARDTHILNLSMVRMRRKAGRSTALADISFALSSETRSDDQICHIDIQSPGLKVLDIGCGDERALWTMKQLGCDVVGVEFDGEAAVTAREFGLGFGRFTSGALRWRPLMRL